MVCSEALRRRKRWTRNRWRRRPSRRPQPAAACYFGVAREVVRPQRVACTLILPKRRVAACSVNAAGVASGAVSQELPGPPANQASAAWFRQQVDSGSHARAEMEWRLRGGAPLPAACLVMQALFLVTEVGREGKAQAGPSQLFMAW